jgi:hypothetical protein
MSPLSRAEVASWYLKAGHRRVWVVPLSVVLAVFVVFLVLRRMAADPYANLQKSRAAILAYKRELPNEKNALYAVSETWKLSVPWDPKNRDAMVIIDISNDRSVLTQVRTENYWKASEPELTALKQALKIPEASSNFDPLKLNRNWPPFFSLLNLRTSANLLSFDAHMNAARGNHAAAAESLWDVRRLADHIDSDPHLVSGVIAQAIRGIPSDDFWSWLLNEAPPLDDKALRAYQQTVDVSDSVYPALARMYEFERCFSLYLVDQAQAERSAGNSPASNSGMYDALMYATDRECMDGVYGDIVGALKKNTFPEDTQALLARHQRGPSLLARMNFGSTHRVMLASMLNHTYARLQHTAFAVQLFQNKYKRDPKSLDELVPEFLKAIPTDFAGHPLKLKTQPFPEHIDRNLTLNHKERNSLRLMIYSFGINGKDEGGANAEKYSGKEPDDCSIQLRGAEQRGVTP